MAKIRFDSNYLNSQIRPYVNSAVDYLKHANSNANSLSCPYDFQYRQTVANLSAKITTMINDLNRFNTWIDNCSKVFDNVEQRHIISINSIDDSLIKKRDNFTL